jgi:hypothetical protein
MEKYAHNATYVMRENAHIIFVHAILNRKAEKVFHQKQRNRGKFFRSFLVILGRIEISPIKSKFSVIYLKIFEKTTERI